MHADEIVGYPSQVLSVHRRLTDVNILYWIELWRDIASMKHVKGVQSHTSLDHTLNVSMSLDAQMLGDPLLP